VNSDFFNQLFSALCFACKTYGSYFPGHCMELSLGLMADKQIASQKGRQQLQQRFETVVKVLGVMSQLDMWCLSRQ
jgi:hypothetical protein